MVISHFSSAVFSENIELIPYIHWKLTEFAIEKNLAATFEASWDKNLERFSSFDPDNPNGGNALDYLDSQRAASGVFVFSVMHEVTQLLVCLSSFV